VALLVATAAPAPAAPPTLGPVEATNIQGVSALLKGAVDPEGAQTSYRFEYVDDASFQAKGFTGAATTPQTPVGSGSELAPARAAISGLTPATLYRFRLVASNADGPSTGEGSFTTSSGFGFRPGEEGFAVGLFADGDVPATISGSHPYSLELGLGFKEGGEFEGQPGVPFPDGDLRDLRVDLPQGLLLNPSFSVTRCSSAEFHTPRVSPFADSRSGESCPGRSQVGTVEVRTGTGGGTTWRFGVYNLDPAPGVAAQLGFAPFETQIALDMHLRPAAEGGYALTLEARDFPQSLSLTGLDLALWGVPWAASHNGERGNCLNEAEPGFPWAKCSIGDPTSSKPLAYLTMPTRCQGSLAFTARASAWQQPAEVVSEAESLDALDQPVPVTSCPNLPFFPQTAGQLNTQRASSPSGFNFRLSNDNEGLLDPALRAPSQTRTATVRLPEGLTINPSLAAGLGACTPAQYVAETATGPPGSGCPNNSKIGDFTVKTPLFEGSIAGAIHLALPDDRATLAAGAENPFDTLIAVYLVGRSADRGVLVKVAGRLVPNPSTGRLTGVFENLPQLPYTDLDVSFRSGQRAPLITPSACGPAVTEIEMAPWRGGASDGESFASPITAGIDGGACPSGATPPFSPDAVTGGVNSNVGSYTPYFVHLSRKDTEQEITSYSLVLPKGITGKLAGIPFCPDAAIEAARDRQGFAETASPSCPAASQVGRTLTGYGIGSALSYAPGRIYLGGPHKGQPLSLVTINSATVGPFDLGTIVIRSAFQVDPRTAQLRIDSRASDPIPHIIDGIPLHLRDIRVYMDRPEFTHNPTSCEASQMVSTLTGSGARFGDPSDDSTVTVSRHFQLLNCLTLGFRPKLGLRLRGGSRRGAYPSLRATFAARGPQDANLKQIEVTMPHALFLAQEHIRTVCTMPQFEADRCPPGSVYGRAVAHTPLFDEPLRGEVYLRTSTTRLPDLVASLHSGAVRIALEGKIGPAKNGFRTVFSNLPDAPINRFTMTLFGGRRGLLTNSSNICKAPPRASVKALGQNNVGSIFTTKLRGQCRRSAKKGGRG
jgi:hypothetical protein